MRTNLIVRVSRVILNGALLSLVTLWGLALTACVVTMDESIIVSDSSTATPTFFLGSAQSTNASTPPLSPTPAPTAFFFPTTPATIASPTLVTNFDIHNLSMGAYLLEPTSFTATFQLEIYNKGSVPSPATIFYLFDGDPQAGGELIVRREFSSVGVNDGDVSKAVSSTSAFWNVKGKAGDHQFFSFLCLAGVPPTQDSCQFNQWTKNIPTFSWGIEITDERQTVELQRGEVGKVFYRGDVVPIRVYFLNLGRSEVFSFTMAIEIQDGGGQQKSDLAIEPVVLNPETMIERIYLYDTTNMWGTGATAILRLEEIEDELPELKYHFAREKFTSFLIPTDAYFMAQPLSGTVPLTVTFLDRSGPAGGNRITGWRWSFGDGATSTLQFPIHTYTQPGAYTVMLTTTVPSQALDWVQVLMTQGPITDTSLLTRTFAFTVTRPNYIRASR